MSKRFFTEQCVIASCKTCPFYFPINEKGTLHRCFVKSDPDIIIENYFKITESCPLFEYLEDSCTDIFNCSVVYYNIEVDSCRNCPNHIGVAGKKVCDILNVGYDENIDIVKENYWGITPSCPRFEISYMKEEQDYVD